MKYEGKYDGQNILVRGIRICFQLLQNNSVWVLNVMHPSLDLDLDVVLSPETQRFQIQLASVPQALKKC